MVVTLYLNFPANTFSQAQQIIMTLVNSGMQVRAFQKSGGSGFGGNNNGGWYNRGGGYGCAIRPFTWLIACLSAWATISCIC